MINSRTTLWLILAAIIAIASVLLYVGKARVPIWKGTAARAAADPPHASSMTSDTSPAPASKLEVTTRRLTDALESPRSFDRTQRLERAAYDLGIENIAAALRQLAALEDPADRATLLRGTFTAAAQLVPQDAIRWIKRVEEGADREVAMYAVATAWRGGVPPPWQRGASVEWALGKSLLDAAQPLPEAAVTWAKELVTDRAESAGLLGIAAQNFGLIDTGRAIALFNELSADREREMFQREFGRAWARRPPEDVWEAARQFPEERLRSAAQTGILIEWARKDPAAAVAALGAIADNSERITGISTVAEIWAAQDTHAVLGWAATLPAEDRLHAQSGINRAAPVGIGAVLDTASDGYPLVRELMADSPARRSGKIPAGSLITGIVDADGQSVDTRHMELSQFVEKVRGPRGTPVTVFVQAPGAQQSTPVELVREQLVHKPSTK